MHKKLLPLFSLAVLALILSAYGKKSKPALPRQLEKIKAVTYVPEGTLNNSTFGSFFIFTNEVSNLEYREFLRWLKKNGNTTELAMALPDSTLWSTEVDANGIELYRNRYQHMNDYPVVNISHEAAEMYCKWLSETWNKNQTDYLVEFRLPTEAEWEYAASGGIEKNHYPWNGMYSRNEKGLYLAQHKAIGLVYGPQKTGSFFANAFGLYNMSGNVAEMVAEKKMVKGGSWNSNEKELRIDTEAGFKKAPWVGFRPLMTFKSSH